MNIKKQFARLACLVAITAFTTGGCNSVVTQRHDRAIAKHAQDSGFPSPSDVGYQESEAEMADAGTGTGSVVR
jgi:hypothetical protein